LNKSPQLDFFIGLEILTIGIVKMKKENKRLRVYINKKMIQKEPKNVMKKPSMSFVF